MTLSVQIVSWGEARPMLRAVRETVFLHEQRVPVEEEWDEHDSVCIHALASDEHGAPIGTGRLLDDGHIGRMAVLAHARGRGGGAAILERLMLEAKHRGHKRLLLHAQTPAIEFYARFGFVAEGGEFMEAGIAHRRMVAELTGPPWRVHSPK